MQEKDAAQEWAYLQLEAGLMILDPSTQDGLVERIPEGVIPEKPLNSYDTKLSSDGEKMNCAQCGHRRNHYRGITVLLSDGSKALVGRNCGEKDFGRDIWGQLESDLEYRQNLVFYEARIKPYEQELSSILDGLEVWLEVAEVVDNFFTKLRKAMPNLYKALRRDAWASGELTYARTVRKTVVGRDGEPQTRNEEVIERLGPVPAATYFRNKPLRTRLFAAGRQIKEVLDRIDKTKGQNGLNEMRSVSRERVEIRREFRDIRDQHHSCFEILDLENRQRVVNWANAGLDDVGKMQSSHSQLIERDDYNSIPIVNFPKSFPKPPSSLIELLGD